MAYEVNSHVVSSCSSPDATNWRSTHSRRYYLNRYRPYSQLNNTGPNTILTSFDCKHSRSTERLQAKQVAISWHKVGPHEHYWQAYIEHVVEKSTHATLAPRNWATRYALPSVRNANDHFMQVMMSRGSCFSRYCSTFHLPWWELCHVPN
jgi:hypothetical protein